MTLTQRKNFLFYFINIYIEKNERKERNKARGDREQRLILKNHNICG